MASLEKLIRAFEAVKVSQSSAINLKSGVGSENRTMDYANTVASLASSLSQQGQQFLRKDHLVLNARDKMAHCHLVTDALLAAKSADVPKMLSIGMETLLLMTDDADADVRMSADEALSRIIRGLAENHMGKIQVELFKEIKKNGHMRTLRTALTRFALLCHHIRPQKCRVYMQSLLPLLTAMAQRPEEPLQEALSSSLEGMMPTLGHFTNDNEVKVLLKAFVPNLCHPSPPMRRAALTSCLALCLHSRKPTAFLGWLVNVALRLVVPVVPDTPAPRVLGTLMCLRLLAPHLSQLLGTSNISETALRGGSGGGHSSIGECSVTVDHLLQIYEVCVFYSSHADHNICAGSLETLQALLRSPPLPLLSTLTSSEGISRSRIFSDPTMGSLHSRASSILSIAPSLYEEDTSALDIVMVDGKMRLEVDSPSGGRSDLQHVENENENDDVESVEVDGEDDDDCHDVIHDVELYSGLPIGEVAEDEILLTRTEPADFLEVSPSRKCRKESGTQQIPENKQRRGTDESLASAEKAVGYIGTFFDEDIPLRYLARHLCSSFLLSGHVGSLLSDRTVRISLKVLALNCIGCVVSALPEVMGQRLFLHEEGDAELQQHTDDLLRYYAHLDPQLCNSIASLIGRFVAATLVQGGGHFSNQRRPALTLTSLLDIVCKLLGQESSVTARGAVVGLKLMLPHLLRSHHASDVSQLLPHLIHVSEHPYWLVKTELCDLFANLPLDYVDFAIGETSLHCISSQLSWLPRRPVDRFSYRLMSHVLVPLLTDQDARVRSASVSAVVRMVPDLMYSGDLMSKAALTHASSVFLVTPEGPSSMHVCLAVPPLDRWCSQLGVTTAGAENLSRLVTTLSDRLLISERRYSTLGLLEALASLSEEYPPVLYLEEWNCRIYSPVNNVMSSDYSGLMSLVLSLASETQLAADLDGQQNILKLSTNLILGFRLLVHVSGNGQSKSQGGNVSVMTANLLEKLMRIMGVYSLVLEDAVLNAKFNLASGHVLSPMKKRDNKGPSTSFPIRVDKTDSVNEGERKVSQSADVISSILHLPEYVKLFDVLKSAYVNYKMSLDESSTLRFCSLLRTVLTCLGRLLEVSTGAEVGRNAEEILHYLTVFTRVLPRHAVECGQQLLKCLYGSNLFGDHHTCTSRSSAHSVSVSKTTSLYTLCLSVALREVEKDLLQMEGNSKGVSVVEGKRLLAAFVPRQSEKSALSSVIRQFEPLVIKALRLYTMSSDIELQRSVLQILIHLVQIRVNYCLLDSDQIFIGYVIKQFEYIEEGQIKFSEQLIPSVFRFLVLLSYERHHSQSIIGVPKIIQLCDGLVAGGHLQMSHCISSLKPLIEDLFLSRSTATSADQRELDTQREVLCNMLLRLAFHHEALHLLTLILQTMQNGNSDHWTKFSCQVVSSILPMLSTLRVDINSLPSLGIAQDLFSAVCPSVYRPIDSVLIALFTSPSDLETTSGVERWAAGNLLLLRILAGHCTQEEMFQRLQELGLSMATGSPANSDSPPDVSFIDPLHVTKAAQTPPPVALSRFLLEVLRVVATEIRHVHWQHLTTEGGTEWVQSKFLVNLFSRLLLLIIHQLQSGHWHELATPMKQFCDDYSENSLTSEVTENVMFVAGWYPLIALHWGKLLVVLQVSSEALWNGMLQSSQRGGSIADEEIETNSLSQELLKKCGVALFAEFVAQHMQEGEWLPWLIVQHINDIVWLRKEPPVYALLQKVYASPAASALLVQAVHTRCDQFDQAEFCQNALSVVSGVHANQSGALVSFIVHRMLLLPHLVVTQGARKLAITRLTGMLARPPDEVVPLFSGENLQKAVAELSGQRLKTRYADILNLLREILVKVHGNNSSPSLEEPNLNCVSNFQTDIDADWYLQLVKSRCCSGEGGKGECSQLLSRLDYDDIVNVMSHLDFDGGLLTHTFRMGLSLTIKMHIVSTGVGEKGGEVLSDSALFGESPLYSASRTILLARLATFVEALPRPSHHPFVPGSSSKYSERLCCMFVTEDGNLSITIESLGSAIVEYLGSVARLPWGAEVNPDSANDVTRFSLLCMEYAHWHCHMGSASISILRHCLACANVTFQNEMLSDLLMASERAALVASMIAALFAVVRFFVLPLELPSLPQGAVTHLNGTENSAQWACQKMMRLVGWLEEGSGMKLLPACVAPLVRGLIVCLGRTALVNSVVRVPLEMWNLDWDPEFSGDQLPVLRSIPVKHLQEPDVLKQFIFRMELLGWVGRTQFEETWMALLSVLNATPDEETPPDEVPIINLSLSLAVRGITSLLIQTLLLPLPGNPHSGHLMHIAKDQTPHFLMTSSGSRLQNTMLLLHEKMRDIHLLVRSCRSSPAYQCGQLSVEYLATALYSNMDPAESPEYGYGSGCYEFEQRETQLKSCGLDVASCLHFLHYLYSSWLTPQSGFAASVVAEVVKSMCCLGDLFTTVAHHKWVLECLVSWHTGHPTEDHLATQYVVLATAKALATLRLAKEEVNFSLGESVFRLVENGLRSGQVSVRMCSLQALLYLLQGPLEECGSLVVMATNYIRKCCDSQSHECETHELAVWELWVYLVEHFETLPDPAFASTALQVALTVVATTSTPPKVLHQVLRGLERLMLVQPMAANTMEVMLKLVMDQVLNGPSALALAALPLFITSLYAASAQSCDAASLEGDGEACPSPDPETLMLFMEKFSVLFDRVRTGLPHEAEVVGALLGPCLLDVLPPGQILNKVITEYISSHQPRPQILALTVFQVFEGAAREAGGRQLVQEWVLLSLANFTQRVHLPLAVWCLTCFFVAACSNRFLRAAFPVLQARLPSGRLCEEDILLFCLAGVHFRRGLETEIQKRKFDDVFEEVGEVGSPFGALIRMVEGDKEKEIQD